MAAQDNFSTVQGQVPASSKPVFPAAQAVPPTEIGQSQERPRPLVEEMPSTNQTTAPVSPPAPKRKLPPFVFWIGGGLVLLVVIFLVIRLVSSFFSGSEPKSEITWWGLWEDPAVVSSLVAEYESSHPGIKINYVRQSKEDYRERLTNSLAKGEGPDIFRFHNTWVPMFAAELDQLPASVMSPSDFSTVFYPVASSDLAGRNGIVGLPLEYDAVTLFINEEIFEKAGKEPPKTWDDLRELAKELTIKDEQGVIVQSGVALGRTENVDHWQEILSLMIIQNGGSVEKPTGKLAEDAVMFFTLFSAADGVWDETMPPSTVAFASGRLAMYFGPSWRSFEIQKDNPGLRFRTVDLPQLPSEGESLKVALASYWVEGVWAQSPNKETAWDFLGFMAERSSLEKLFLNAAKTRDFGEPYSKVEMASLLKDHPILGSIIALADGAESSYLVSRTFDGPTGINSQISSYMEDAVNGVNAGTKVAEALLTASQGIEKVLKQYGVILR